MNNKVNKYRPEGVLNINDVQRINLFCHKNPNAKVLIEIDNTIGLSINLLKHLNERVEIRVAGAYDKKRISLYKNITFYDPDKPEFEEKGKTYYYNPVIYSRNELINILGEIEDIESGINKNWSKLQVLIYLYDVLKSRIMYDPKYNSRDRKYVASLRCLITRQAICAGYSLVLKELLDRQGIECHYIVGNACDDEKEVGHAWNIVAIDGKGYALDLTQDNSSYRKGDQYTFDYLGQDPEEFNEVNIPDPFDPYNGYQDKLSTIPLEFIYEFEEKINRHKKYDSSTYRGKRVDGTEYIVSQIEDVEIEDTVYYRYYYAEIDENGKYINPLILYSDVNVSEFIDDINFKREIPKKIEYESAIYNCLFSKENIQDSIFKGTQYIGCLKRNLIGDEILVNTSFDVEKDADISRVFNYKIKKLTRSDGSTILVEDIDKIYPGDGTGINIYDIFEFENGVPEKFSVFTEMDLLNDDLFLIDDDILSAGSSKEKGIRSKRFLTDVFLSKDRLKERMKIAGGYLGYYDEYGKIITNPLAEEYFDISKRMDLPQKKR